MLRKRKGKAKTTEKKIGKKIYIEFNVKNSFDTKKRHSGSVKSKLKKNMGKTKCTNKGRISINGKKRQSQEAREGRKRNKLEEGERKQEGPNQERNRQTRKRKSKAGERRKRNK